METDTVKAETGRKSRPLNDSYKSVVLTENEVQRSLRILDGRTPTHLEFETKRPQAFLPLGSCFRFRNLFPNYGWRIRAWAPRDCGRTLIVCGLPEKIYGLLPRPKKPTARYTGRAK